MDLKKITLRANKVCAIWAKPCPAPPKDIVTMKKNELVKNYPLMIFFPCKRSCDLKWQKTSIIKILKEDNEAKTHLVGPRSV